MNMDAVSSSTIAAVGYDFDSLALYVQFKAKGEPGPIYRYDSVPSSSYYAMLRAESVGQFFAKYIRPHFKAAKQDGSQ